MRIREFEAGSSAEVDGWLGVEAAALAVDLPDFPAPCRDEFLGGLRVPWPGGRSVRFVAEDGGRIVGVLHLHFNVLDNVENVELDFSVHPEARRRGIGTALHDLAVVEGRRGGGRRLMTESVRGLAGGPARVGAGSLFAPTVGAKLGQTEIRRRLDMSTVDRGQLDGRIAALGEFSAGYSVMRWDGAAPDDVVGGIATLESRFLSEAPVGELAWEPQKVDVDRIRASERSRVARGRRQYNVVARHDATGEIVAWTSLDRMHCPDTALEQGITLVLPEHRGHRLGLLLKLVNLAFAADNEPAVTVVDTWNAEENDHMIAINEAVGFRAVDAWDAWQREL